MSLNQPFKAILIMKTYLKLTVLFMVAIILFSCQDDNSYIIGGEKNTTNRFDVTTFELLSEMDETKVVAQLFEKAGLKDVINGDVTVIAPNQWSVNRYLRRKHNQALRVNPDAPAFTIDDIPASELKRMGMYIIPGKWWGDSIPASEKGGSVTTGPKGGKILKAYDGSDVYISRDKTNTDPGSAYDAGNVPGYGYQYSNFLQDIPYIIHVHFKRGIRWEYNYARRSALTDYYDNPECDHVYRMYVSDILTKNGVVHVLYQGDYNYTDHYYYHTLFFFGTRKDDLL